MYSLSKAAKWPILLWRLFCLSKAGSSLSRSMLEVEHIFELGILYNLRFIESDICLPLFEYETQTEHKNGLHIVTTSEFSVYWAQNRELSTDPCSGFLYSLGPYRSSVFGCCLGFAVAHGRSNCAAVTGSYVTQMQQNIALIVGW